MNNTITRGLLLAGGLGNRLRPLTNTIPKVMIEIGGKPLLEYHINLLRHYGITEIWINLHWLPDQITNYFGDGSKWGVDIHYSFEKELLGSAGALKNPDSNIEETFRPGPFVVDYGDNLTNYNIGKLMDFHKEKNALFTMGLYRYPEPWTMGVIEIDQQGKVLEMVEKPPKEEAKSNLVNAGVYICEPEVIDKIPAGFSDFGMDIIPGLVTADQVYALETGDYVQDTGTFERLEKARSNVVRLNLL